jgi:hypothetical protein
MAENQSERLPELSDFPAEQRNAAVGMSFLLGFLVQEVRAGLIF